MSYFDEELEKELSDSNINFEELKSEAHVNFVLNINKAFPFSGSKIAWGSFPNSLSYIRNDADQAFMDITNKITDLNISEIIFIGDSLTENAYKISAVNLEKTLSLFSEIPQHTYFFSGDLGIIGCISSEGEINFCETPS
ncbi:hypothetical protein A8L59_15790 [Pseudomonas koreensis]|uniref:Uncharacterized protein n=1 Tax=Pseudomonas koreensis TaxID=198620 RepID=A0AAC9BUX1_9PSED|nr:hypothetical protein [Pseudomonas koreensis]ANH98814.1 hypothetical protein A8L59_15790 [Pseudomonas koreensis]